VGNIIGIGSPGKERLIVGDDEIWLFPLDFLLKLPDERRGIVKVTQTMPNGLPIVYFLSGIIQEMEARDASYVHISLSVYRSQ
jgi:hypothetical protein